MKLATLSFVLVAAAACGGKSKPAAQPPAAGGVPPEWSAVLVEGATFTLDNTDPDPSVPTDDRMVIVATIHDVRTTGDVTRASIKWTSDDGEEEATVLVPTTVQVGPAGVWFANVNDADADAVLAGPPTFPAGADKTRRDGYYDSVTRNADGSVCYGWETDEEADPEGCEDDCSASLCVAPGKGIVFGEGNWWPESQMYRQVAK